MPIFGGEGRHVSFFKWAPLRDHLPPKPPSSAPTQTKRVPVCSFLNSASNLHNHQDLKLKFCRVWGKNWDTDAHAHMTYQGPTTGLHSCTLLPFLQNSTEYLMLAQSWKFGVNWLDSPRGLHPSACASALRHVHRPPLLPNLLKKGGN
jgi:hypothetical protein